jgi:hypothetical protein
MPAADFEKFIKLMMMTTSSHDHEALNAIRMANSFLAGMNRNWEEVLRGKVTIVGGREAPRNFQQHTNEDEINAIFEKLFATVSERSTFRKFVEDVHSYWERRGYLTTAQYDALKNAVNRSR